MINQLFDFFNIKYHLGYEIDEITNSLSYVTIKSYKILRYKVVEDEYCYNVTSIEPNSYTTRTISIPKMENQIL